jgi:Gluconolactonase
VRSSRFTVRAATVIAALVLQVSCVLAPGPTPPAGAGAPVATTQVWPPPPAPARVRFVRSVSSAADWGISRGLLGRISDAFTGRRDDSLVRPTGVAERDGVLYVADPGAQSLVILDGQRHRETRVHRLGNLTLMSPVSVALGPADTVFVADSFLKQVYCIARDGTLVRTLAHEAWSRPAAIAYDGRRDRLYLADSMAHRVFVMTAEGKSVGSLGEHGDQPGAFNSPTHLALDGDGNLLVTDALNFRILTFTPDGRLLGSFGSHGDGAGNFAAPKGVATDAAGHVYVADAMFDAVQIFRRDGRLLLGFGTQGVGPGEFWLPNGITISASGHLYVADAYNRRLQEFEILPGPPDEASAP